MRDRNVNPKMTYVHYRGGFRGGRGGPVQTVFIKIKLIINNAPLTYIYPNTFRTYLTSTTDKIKRISNHFWHRWRHETYVVNLRETQQASKLNTNSQKNYVVLVYDEKVPRHFWRIAIVTGVLPSRDSETKRSDSEN